MFTSVLVFLFSHQLLQMLPAQCVTFIWQWFMIVQILGPFMVLIFLCPGANAMPNEQAFPDIPFKVFNDFVVQNFNSKVTLATVLMLFFTMTENTDLLNLHQRQQNPQLSDEKRVNLSSWIKSLACEVKRKTPKQKFKVNS